MASLAAIRSRPRSHSEARPITAPVCQQLSSVHAPIPVPIRSPRSLSRPLPLKINVDTHRTHHQSSRRGSANLALRARDSVSVRKRTMSAGAMSARVARQNARKASAGPTQPNEEVPDASSSGLARGRSPSRPPADTPSTRTNSHRNRPPRHSSSPSSSSPSQSPTPITPGHPVLSGAPSSFHARPHPRTHVPHNSQGTTTSAYPPSSSQSSRSSSPSPELSRTSSPHSRLLKSTIDSTPHTPSLDLDPDDVNARLRLLVNNSYYLPPAHTKPELSPIYLSPTPNKGLTSPSAFKEFFRVGKKREKKAADLGPDGRRVIPSMDSPRSLSSGSDGRYGTPRHGDGYFDFQRPPGTARNRVVVVRETLDDLPMPTIRFPLRTSSLPSQGRPRTAPQTSFIDPTTQYDMPPPTHYPSYAQLRLDAAGITGDVPLDQFAPPGEPWSPAPPSPYTPHRSGSANEMDAQERVWRRALLEQAVDLSLSSAASDPGHVSPDPRDKSFARPLKVSVNINLEDSAEPTSPRSPKSKKSWWGRRDKDVEDGPHRPSISSNKEHDVWRGNGSENLDVQVQPPQAPMHNIGQRILENVHAELEAIEREQARQDIIQTAGLPSPLQLRPFPPFGGVSISAPVTPTCHPGQSSTPTLPMTPLRPRPVYRRSDTRRDPNAFGEHVARDFIHGHSTIRKSLSSPLLSDLHELGVNVEEPLPFPNSSNESLNGVVAPSLVLQDPYGVTSLVPSRTADSSTSASHYSDDDQEMFDAAMTPHEQHIGLHEDNASVDRWNTSLSNPDHGEGRPSFDSFGCCTRSPECPARASSTFGFRQSTASVANTSLQGPTRPDIEVDISGDPMDHLSMMEPQRSVSPSGVESQTSSVMGYTSALDHPFHGSEAHSIRPSSPASQSLRSTDTRLASIRSQPRQISTRGGNEAPAPISFFDSVQHQSYMDEDSDSSDSNADVDEPSNIQTALYSDKPSHTQTLERKSLNTTHPSVPAFSTQFRNTSQPQLPFTRAGTAPSDFDLFRPLQPYDFLDRTKPLTNTPLSTSPIVSQGILSQIKAKNGKIPRSFANKSKKPGSSPVVLPQSTFELMRYPYGSTFSLDTGAVAGTRSEADGAELGLGSLDRVKSKGSLPSLKSSPGASLKQVRSWKQEHNAQDEGVRKLDGMLMQHLEAEKDRLRKIASAAREKGGS